VTDEELKAMPHDEFVRMADERMTMSEPDDPPWNVLWEMLERLKEMK
jgi:hypothetical protein